MLSGNCVNGRVTAPAQDLPETPVEVAWYHWLWVWFAALVLRLWLATLRVHANVPRIEVSYHRSEGEARAAYDGCLDLVGSDHSKILLVRVDEETMTQTIIDSFEGTDEEFDGE